MSRSKPLLPPLSEQLAEGTPVVTREQALDLNKRVLALTTTENTSISIKHTVRSITRFVNDQVRNTDDGESLALSIRMGDPQSPNFVLLQTNQLDEISLQDMV